MATNKKFTDKKSLAEDFIPRIVCVFVAVIIWLYAVYNSDPDYEKSFDGVSVTPLNSGMLDDRDLTVYGDINSTIEVVIYGNRGNITTYSKEDVKATVDLIGITEAGYHTAAVKITVPDGATVKSYYPKEVTVQIEEVASKEVPVKAVPQYNSAYVSGEATPSVDVAVVKGPRTELELVDHVEARPVFDKELATSMTAIGAELVACTKDGSIIESSYMGIEPAAVDVDIPLYDEKEIPITVLQTNDKFANVIENISVSPQTLTVRRRINGGVTLDGIDELVVAEFDEGDLTGLRRTEKIVLPIELDDAYENMSEVEEVTVSVTYNSNTTVMAFNCANFEIENPDSKYYTMRTRSLEVYIRLPSSTAIELSGTDDAFDNFVFEGSLYDVDNGRIKVTLNVPDEYEGSIYAVGEYYVEVDVRR